MAEPFSLSFSILASVLSISASIKQLMESKKISRDAAFKLFEAKASEQEQQIISNESHKSAILSVADTIISVKLLKQLTSEAQQCEDEHIEARKSANSQNETNEADIAASQCMCTVLRSVKYYNNGKLPGDILFENWWKSYRCTD